MVNIPRRFNIQYSTKNIPTVSKFKYQYLLTYRIENLVSGMRWKGYWDKNKHRKKEKQTYGFKSLGKAPPCDELKAFEEDLFKLIRSVETKPFNNPLQDKMKSDLRVLQNHPDQVVIASDKTSNFYMMDANEYKETLDMELRKTYKKAGSEVVQDIDAEAAYFANKLKRDDRIEGMALKPSFLTIKDHKENFPAQVSYRLISPTNSNLGAITKIMIQSLNLRIKETLGLNLCRSTKEAIDWFTGLKQKKKMVFLKFDIESYFPSISKSLLLQAFDFVRGFDFLSKFEAELILHCRRSVVVGNKGEIWLKTEDEKFYVTMGSKDSAEISELVGLYVLHLISQQFPKEAFILYRDDGMAAVMGGKQEMEKWKKKLYSLFQGLDLRITVEGGSKVIDFLDVIFDLDKGSYCPYVKPNTTTKYVSIESSHPDAVLKTIPSGVAKRLSTNSSSKAEFENHTHHFKEAMIAAGHQTPLEYTEEEGCSKKKKRKRNEIYFNPPWSSNVTTNIAAKFLTLVRKHFSKGSPLYHLFNDKKLKVSYSTTANMKRLISNHNARVLNNTEGLISRPVHCNCFAKGEVCPLDGECHIQSLVYKADVDAGGEVRSYIGQTANTFRTRWQGHNSNVRRGRKATTLCTHRLELKRKGVVEDSIKWSKLKEVNPRRKGDKICALCNTEKTHIAVGNPDILLNKRNEIMQRCRHRDNLVLSNNLTIRGIQQIRNNGREVMSSVPPTVQSQDTRSNYLETVEEENTLLLPPVQLAATSSTSVEENQEERTSDLPSLHVPVLGRRTSSTYLEDYQEEYPSELPSLHVPVLVRRNRLKEAVDYTKFY